MKVLLLTPAPTDTHRGPAATVTRYREGLQRRGHLCELVGDTDEGRLRESLAGTVGRFKPDLVHAHHAAGAAIDLLGLRVPWVVSLSGEDVYVDMLDDARGPLVCEVLRNASRILVPSSALEAVVEERVPETVGKLDVVPRGWRELPTGGTDLRRSLGIPKKRVVVLLAGGIRPVKGQHRALSLVRILRGAGVDAEMVIVGPEQDGLYASELRQLAKEEPGIRILPPLSPERMGATYMDADVVLNTSLDEGQSPVILEAGILGRPVVASDVPGNRELIKHKETGLLFSDEESLAKSVIALIRNRSAAGALGVRLREDLKRRFDPEHEIDRLLSAYAAA